MQLYLQWRRIEQLVCSRDPECWPVCLGGSEKRGTEVGAVFACLFGGSLNDSRGSWALAAALPSLCMRTSTCRLAALAGSVLLASNSDSTDATSCEPFWNTYECFESVFEWIFEIHFLIFWNIVWKQLSLSSLTFGLLCDLSDCTGDSGLSGSEFGAPCPFFPSPSLSLSSVLCLFLPSFLSTALLRYTSYIIQLTHLQCIKQWFLVSWNICGTIISQF